MRTIGLRMITAIVLVCASTVGASGQQPITIDQPATAFELSVTDAGVPAGAPGVTISRLPTHIDPSQVEPDDGVWTLHPQPSFWTVGNDRLEVSWTGLTPGSATVLLVAGRPGVEYRNGFEFGENVQMDQSRVGNAVSIGADGAIFGGRGLYIEVNDGTGSIAIDVPCCDQSDSNSSGSQAYVDVEDPPAGGGTITFPEIAEIATVIATYDQHDDLLAELQVRALESGPEMRLVGHGNSSLTEGTWFGIDYDTTMKVRLDGYYGITKSTILLTIDDRQRASLPEFDTSSREATIHRFGVPEGGSSIDFRLKLDAVELGEADPTPEWQLALAEDFPQVIGPSEFPQWANEIEAAGTLNVNNDALEISLTNPSAWGAYLIDDTPAQADGYNVRFSVDTSLLEMDPSDQMHMLIGYPNSTGNNHLQVRIRRDGGDFEIRADAKDNNGGFNNIPWLDVTRGEHLIEVQWRAASDPTVADGYVRLFIDGQYAGEVTGIQNDQRRIEEIRFGAMGVDDGTSGTIVYDDFASYTASPPDPLP